MVQRRVADGSHLLEDINSGQVIGDEYVLTDNRPWRTYYNPYGEAHRFPADPVQMALLAEGGWTIFPPANPLPRPTSQKMRNGSVFEFASSGADPSPAEMARLNGGGQPVASVAPTATYYTAEGTAIPGLPADPQSMADYLKAGLTLNPPATEAASS